MAKRFEKMKIELSEKNERIFREIHQFTKGISLEAYINNYIADKLFWDGFE